MQQVLSSVNRSLTSTISKKRIESIELLRGVVIIIMAIMCVAFFIPVIFYMLLHYWPFIFSAGAGEI